MSELTVHAYAKINLTLEILRRLPSGYHEVKSVMQQTALHDTITLRDAHAGITIESANANVPFNEHNTVWKAAALLKQHLGINRGVKFRLTKRIPIGGGMGGGSADGAAALLGLNRLWQLGLSQSEILALGAEIGMDVPFCILGGTALATGRGDVVQRLPSLPTFHIVIVNPGLPISTSQAYAGLDLELFTFADKSAQMLDAIARGDRDAIIANLHNDFERVIFDQYPAIGEIKRRLLDAGLPGALLSGSGASVFGIAETEAQARAAVEALKYDYPFIVATQTKSPAHNHRGNPNKFGTPAI